MVAAEGVVPGQPVDQHRRLLGQRREALPDHLLVRAQHALGVDHALGQLGRARGEQELGDRVGADRGVRGVDRGGRLGREQVGERASSRGRRALPSVEHDRRLGRHDGGDRLARTPARSRTPGPGVSMLEDVAQLAVVLRDQRIRRRDRRERHAGEHRAEREQEVLEVVVGQDRDRPLGREAAVEQRLGDGARALQRLARS